MLQNPVGTLHGDQIIPTTQTTLNGLTRRGVPTSVTTLQRVGKVGAAIRAQAALVSCGLGNGLLPAEPGAGGGYLAELVRVLCLAYLGDQCGLGLP